MFPLDCKLLCSSAGEHINQIYTGFAELRKRRLVRVSATRLPGYRGRFYGDPAWLRIRLNDLCDIIYDVSDSYFIPETLDLTGVDFYFKRSYWPEYLATLHHKVKVYPLGLNYLVFSDRDFPWRRAWWAQTWKDFFSQAIRFNPLLARLLRIQGSIFTSHLDRFEGVPKCVSDPKVLFMAHLWDPAKGRSPEERDELWAMAQTRSGCIRKLRAEFGARFLGGFRISEFAERNFKDCILSSPRDSRKDRYMRQLQDASICIATTGLHGSVGWKFAEYIAGAKAIVSEKLNCILPGDCAAGRNYLEFTNPEKCVESAVQLVENRQKRRDMMNNNYSYYQNWLRPDMLVLRPLLKVLSESDIQQACMRPQSLPFEGSLVGCD